MEKVSIINFVCLSVMKEKRNIIPWTDEFYFLQFLRERKYSMFEVNQYDSERLFVCDSINSIYFYNSCGRGNPLFTQSNDAKYVFLSDRLSQKTDQIIIILHKPVWLFTSVCPLWTKRGNYYLYNP